jgi:hypothetical protein
LNFSGKELISIKLSMVIKEFFIKKQPYALCLQWKGTISAGLKCGLSKTEVWVVNPKIPDQNNLDELSGISDPSKRQRKNVALGNADFLCT